MRLFVREHLLLIGLQAVQAVFIPLLFWLDGYRGTGVIFYAIFLSFVFLTVLFSIPVSQQKKFLPKVGTSDGNFGRILGTDGKHSNIGSPRQILRSQYRLHQETSTSKDRQEEHLLFIDRWVHQMKTPLSVIELTAQTLDEPESSSIREETERMKHGLNMVLHMARLGRWPRIFA